MLRYRRTLLAMATSRFWRMFKRNKKGMFGLIVLGFFISMAALAPYISAYDPIRDVGLADPVSPPSWMRMFPKYKGVPPYIDMFISPEDWRTEVQEDEGGSISISLSDKLVILYRDIGSLEIKKASVRLTYEFDYKHKPCDSFEITFGIDILSDSAYQYMVLRAFITNVDSNSTYELFIPKPPRVGELIATFKGNHSYWDPPMSIRSASLQNLLLNKLPIGKSFASTVFSERGRYMLTILVEIVDYMDDDSKLTVELSTFKFHIKGEVFGLLGTNHYGQDIWSQFVWGARISLLVGLMAALMVVCIGTIIGLIAGYKGGIVDQILVFLTDIVWLMPVMPLIIASIMILREPNIFAIIAIIAIFAWPGLARQIRALVMSLKERAFVEAARAVGCSHARIMFKHVLPQLVPLIMYSMVMSIPGAILTEAAISIVGLGSPFIPSWGKMVNEAWHNGLKPGMMAWWWIGPPLLGIFFLCTAFVYVGFALDEILNPRLRRR